MSANIGGLIVPTREVYQRVFCIDVWGHRGTAFLVPVGDEYCLLTAKHLVTNVACGSEFMLKIFKDDEWAEIPVIPYYQDGEIDIAVLKTYLPVGNDESGLRLDMGHLYVGQDVFFLGFPFFGRITYRAEPLMNNFPLPLLKKGIYSGMSGHMNFLDGHNNEGFSGGPVVYYNYESKRMQIGGVLHGYIKDTRRVSGADISVDINSGIVVFYNANKAVEIIKQVYGRLPNANT